MEYRPLINTPGKHRRSIREQSGHTICLLAFPEIYTSLSLSLSLTHVSQTTFTLHQPYMKNVRESYSFPYFIKYSTLNPAQFYGILFPRYENPNARNNCKLFATVHFICS